MEPKSGKMGDRKVFGMVSSGRFAGEERQSFTSYMGLWVPHGSLLEVIMYAVLVVVVVIIHRSSAIVLEENSKATISFYYTSKL